MSGSKKTLMNVGQAKECENVLVFRIEKPDELSSLIAILTEVQQDEKADSVSIEVERGTLLIFKNVKG